MSWLILAVVLLYLALTARNVFQWMRTGEAYFFVSNTGKGLGAKVTREDEPLKFWLAFSLQFILWVAGILVVLWFLRSGFF